MIKKKNLIDFFLALIWFMSIMAGNLVITCEYFNSPHVVNHCEFGDGEKSAEFIVFNFMSDTNSITWNDETFKLSWHLVNSS